MSKRPYRLFPSTLHLMDECKRCFWLKHNKNVKRPTGIFMSLPNGIDHLLKRYFDRYAERGEVPPELRNLEPGIRPFPDREKLAEWQNNFKGITWQETEESPIFGGAVDNILLAGNRLLVVDYKTRGFPLKENTHERYTNQMDVYNHLLRLNGHETMDYTALLFYWPKDEASDAVQDIGRRIDQRLHEAYEEGERSLSQGDGIALSGIDAAVADARQYADELLSDEMRGMIQFNTEIVKVPVDVGNAQLLFSKATSILEGEMPEQSGSCEYCTWYDRMREVLE